MPTKKPTPNNPTKIDASFIKSAIAAYWKKKRLCSSFEVGLNRRGRLRADVVSLSMRGQIIVTEVKSSVADFMSDHKWQGYMAFCHRFYFAMSVDTYKRLRASGHLPSDPGVGIILVNPNFHAKVFKTCRSRGIDAALQTSIYIRMAFRASDVRKYKR